MSELNLSKIFDEASDLAPLLEKIDKATNLSTLVLATLNLARAMAVIILKGCRNRQFVPYDEVLAIAPYQRTRTS